VFSVGFDMTRGTIWCTGDVINENRW